MTICNMSIEFGAKMGLMNPDQKTYDYVEWAVHAHLEKFEEAVADWKTLVSDPDEYDKVIIDASELAPMVTWGTNPKWVELDQPFQKSRVYR